MNLGLPTSNWQCLPDMRSFSPYHVNEFYQSSGFTRKRRNNIDVKCYRYGQFGHFRKQCNSNTKKQKSMKHTGYCNAERYKCPPNEQYKYFWISICNIIIYLETKFRQNRRIFVFWRSFWIQNGHHSKPKWSQYGAACLTPSKYPFPLKSFHFWISLRIFYFLYWRPFFKF